MLIPLLIVILTICWNLGESARLLPSPLGSDAGDGGWNHWQMCEEGTYLLGIYVTATPPKSSVKSDDTSLLGLTQLKLMCGNSDGAGLRVVLKNLTSGPDLYHQSNKNAYMPSLQTKYCKQYALGFNLKNLKETEVEKFPDIGKNSLGMRLHCAGTPAVHLDGGLDDLGSYQTPAGTLCTSGEYLCGARFKSKLVKDVLIVTNMDGRCCSDLPISKSCTPSESWIPVYEYDNRDSGSSVNIQFSTKSYARWVVIEEEDPNPFNRRSIPITGTTAFINNLIDPLVPRFGKELGQHKEFGYDWSKLTKANWMAERLNSFSAQVEPHSRLRMDQLVGRCGVVETLADSFRISSQPQDGFGGGVYLGVVAALIVLFLGLIVLIVGLMWKRNEREVARMRVVFEQDAAKERGTLIQTTETDLNFRRY